MKKLLTALLCLALLAQLSFPVWAEDELEIERDQEFVFYAEQERDAEDVVVEIEESDTPIVEGVDEISLDEALGINADLLELDNWLFGNSEEGTVKNQAEDIINSGKCGDNLTWMLDELGVLTISGTGKMWDFSNETDYYDYHVCPWTDNKDNIRKVIFENGITYVGSKAFEDCIMLDTVIFSDTIIDISDFAFRNCEKLDNIKLPAYLESLRGGVFTYTNISSLTYPGTVGFAGSCDWCNNLRTVVFNARTRGSFMISNGLFANCPSLESITVEEGHRTLHSHEGVLYFKNILLQYPNGKKSNRYEVEDGCNIIGAGAFLGTTMLQTISLPRSINSIESNAFGYCKNLNTVEYEGSEEEWKAISIDYGNEALINASITFNIPSERHIPVTDAAVPATCTTTGLTEGSHCSACGMVIVAQQSIPATGHTPVTDPAVPATYTQTGLTEGSHCSVCGEIIVQQQIIPKLEPTGVILNKKKATLYVGMKLNLMATAEPSEAETILTWTSSNNKVATVNSEGVVKALKKGTAIITVTTSNGLSATCKITVPVAPTKVVLNKKKATMKVGKKLQLKASLTPTKAKTAFTWTSSNKKVATVSSKGVVKALKPGKTKITVKTANGKKATIIITVTKK